jgi:hypothetical protein
VLLVNVLPVAPATLTPPICHWKLGAAPPFVAVAVNVTLVPVHIVLSASFELTITLGTNVGFTVIVIPILVALDGLTHISALGVMITLTMSVSTKVVLVNVLLVAPATSPPLICHWKLGATPPFVAVAVNVTLAPAHIVLSASLELTTTLGTTFGLTVIVITALVALEGLTHISALGVITTVTVWLFVKVLLVNVLLVAPATLPPLICHWKLGVTPPFVAVAVNVTLVPVQIELSASLLLTLTLGTTFGFTTILIAALVAVAGLTHTPALGVMITVTA